MIETSCKNNLMSIFPDQGYDACRNAEAYGIFRYPLLGSRAEAQKEMYALTPKFLFFGNSSTDSYDSENCLSKCQAAGCLPLLDLWS